ncbi:hypothetical protein [Paracoccus sp. (in: a-proteobacteria)]|uniref:hypothetical protein n=1 Tax=Paracoccus sp. TaxID=267 RepID=UPI00396C8C87
MHVEFILISKLPTLLRFDHHGQTLQYRLSPDAAFTVARWQINLGLSADEIPHFVFGNMRAHGSAANGPKTLTRHMQDFAAAKIRRDLSLLNRLNYPVPPPIAPPATVSKPKFRKKYHQ